MKSGDTMFRRILYITGTIGLTSLLLTSQSYAVESPHTLVNKEENANISTQYEPQSLTLTTKQGQILYNYNENKK